MDRIKDWLTDPKYAARIHTWSALLWFFVGIPVSVLWLANSTPWIVAMSLYAIVVAHWGGFQGAHAEKRVKDNE